MNVALKLQYPTARECGVMADSVCIVFVVCGLAVLILSLLFVWARHRLVYNLTTPHRKPAPDLAQQNPRAIGSDAVDVRVVPANPPLHDHAPPD